MITALAAVLLLAACTNTRKTTGTTASTDETIVNKYWKLFQLEGKPITMSDNQEREAHFILGSDGRVKGHTGCNGLGGEYKLEAGHRIRFSNMLGTLRYCEEVPWESEFKNVFNIADNYTMHNDTLWLNVGRRAPLAGFVAVYLK